MILYLVSRYQLHVNFQSFGRIYMIETYLIVFKLVQHMFQQINTKAFCPSLRVRLIAALTLERLFAFRIHCTVLSGSTG